MKINESKSSIAFYQKLVKLRDILKDVQQLSWNITQFEKKFPLDSADEKDYPELLTAYVRLGQEIDGIAHLFREEIIDDPIVNSLNEMKQNENEDVIH